MTRPVLANALGLAAGVYVMALSPLQIHVTLAVLMWVTMPVSAMLSADVSAPTRCGGR